MKKLSLWFMAICLLICSAFAVACGGKGKGDNSVATQEYVTLSKTSLSLEVYSQETLTVTTNVDGEIAWTTSDASIATVEGGVISACGVGNATITATAGKASATCTLTVTHLSSFPELVVSERNLALVEGGESITVSAEANYKGEKLECSFIWESANPDVATVENGKVTPVAIGTTTVMVKTECLGEILIQEIGVVVSPDEQIQLSKGTMQLTLAQINAEDIAADTLIAQAYKNGGANPEATLTFESSDPAVASVTVNGNEATVTAVGLGACVIRVYYDSDKGRIESSVTVTVARAEAVVDKLTKVSYKNEETALDVSSFDLVGEFEGVYANGELVSSADGKLTRDFVEINKNGFAVDVELRTDVAVYYTQIAIVIDYMKTAVIVGETSEKLAAYEGDVTSIGFAEGDAVSTYTVTGNNKAWSNRLSPYDVGKVPSFDHWIVEFSVNKEPVGIENSGQIMTVWVGTSHLVVVKVVNMAVEILRAGDYVGTKAEHSAQSCVSIYGEDGKIPAKMEANKKYYFEMHFAHAESGYYAMSFNDALDVYVGDSFFCTDAYYNENIAPNRDNTALPTPPPSVDPTLPPVSQGDDRREMPTYDGDVTEIGFLAGTEPVYQVVASESLGWNNRIIMRVDPSKDYVKFDFTPSKDIGALTMWPANANGTHGSYAVRGQGSSTSDGDPNRRIVVVDQDGKNPATFEKGVVYTVYFYLNDETNVQCSSFVDVTLYIANIECGNAEDAVFETTVVQGDGRTEMPTYDGDVTAIGFAEGTTVYKLDNATPDSVYTDAWSKRAIISAPTTQDYVTFEFVTTSDITNGVFHVWGVNGVPDMVAIWVVTTEKALITNMDGTAISAIKAGTHYLVNIACAGLKEIQVGLIAGDNTAYFANVEYKQGTFGAVTPDEPTDKNPVINGYGQNMDVYSGDVTALGFAEGTIVYQQVQDTRTNMWSAGSTLGLSMEQQTARITKATDEDYASIYFSLSRKLTGTYAFFAWWFDAENKNNGGAGYLQLDGGTAPASTAPTGFKVVVYDMDGNKATSFEANTAYEMRWYGEGATAFNVGCCEQDGNPITVYYTNPAHGNDEIVNPDDGSTTVDANLFAVNGGSLSVYQGDVTALGFAQGTEVLENGFKSNTWADGVQIPTDATTNCLTLEFVLSAVPPKGEQLMIGATIGGEMKWGVRISDFQMTYNAEVDRPFPMELLDANGNPLTAWVANEKCTMKLYHGGASMIYICTVQAGFTVYYNNAISQTNDVYVAPAVNTAPKYTTDGGHSNETAAEYTGDVTALGFAEGTKVYEQTVANGWNDRVAIEVDSAYDYVDIQFVLSSKVSLCIWINGESGGMLTGNYTVDGSGNAAAVNGALERKIQVLDKDGNVVTTELELNKVYVLRIYIDGLAKVQLSTFSGATKLYYGNVSFGNDEVVAE